MAEWVADLYGDELDDQPEKGNLQANVGIRDYCGLCKRCDCWLYGVPFFESYTRFIAYICSG
jgi:hypothetical protein